MRVRPDDVTVNKCRTTAGTDVRDCFLHRGITGERVGTVNLSEVEIRKVRDEFGNIAARRLHFDRYGDGVAIVFNDEQHGEPARRRRVQRLPEFALTRGAFAAGDVGDFITVENNVFEGGVI